MIKSAIPIFDSKDAAIAASECIAGTRGIKGEVSRATSVSYREIRRGLAELSGDKPDNVESSARIRKVGGGRKLAVEKNPELIKDLQALVEPSTLGDPCAPLLQPDSNRFFRKSSEKI